MFRSTASLLAMAALLAACGTTTRDRPVALAELRPTAGNAAEGSAWFVQDRNDVIVHARVKGLKPGSDHGFHVHERGDCSNNGEAAGGHFNPTKMPHGGQSGPHHAGDIPSLKADAAGVAEAKFRIAGVLMGGGDADMIGKAVVVHANPDDYTSQPSGNAGPRIACGVLLTPTGGENPKFVPAQM